MGLFFIDKYILEFIFCKHVFVFYFLLLHMTFKIKPYLQLCVILHIYFSEDIKLVEFKSRTSELLLDLSSTPYNRSKLVWGLLLLSAVFLKLCITIILNNANDKKVAR